MLFLRYQDEEKQEEHFPAFICSQNPHTVNSFRIRVEAILIPLEINLTSFIPKLRNYFTKNHIRPHEGTVYSLIIILIYFVLFMQGHLTMEKQPLHVHYLRQSQTPAFTLPYQAGQHQQVQHHRPVLSPVNILFPHTQIPPRCHPQSHR